MKLIKDDIYQRKELKNEINASFTLRVTKNAMELSDIKKNKVIVLASQELINKNKVAALKSYKGKIDLDMNLDSLRNRKAHSDRLFFPD